ncbi:hypothetical protein N7524_000132, partial [Penicillium chrysogenum]
NTSLTLDSLASEPWFFNQPNKNIDTIRARLGPSLNLFLDSIYDPTPGFFYWVSRPRMGLADESSPLGDNYFEDKERFAVIYDTTPDPGSHCLSVLYDQLNHHASIPLTIENSESIEPVAEHWDISICSEWENSRPIHGIRTRSNHACSFLCQYPGMNHFFTDAEPMRRGLSTKCVLYSLFSDPSEDPTF